MKAFKYVVLGDLTAKEAWEKNLCGEIADITRLPPCAVEDRLTAVHGRTLLRNLFAVEWPDEATDLGALTVGQARELGLVGRIAMMIGRSETSVRLKLALAHKKTRIQNLFADDWPAPEGPALSEAEIERQRLGNLPARHALDRSTIVRIAELTQLGLNEVEDRLRKSHGNKRVRNLFEEKWEVQTDASNKDTLDWDTVGELTARQALEDEAAVPQIARLTGLDENKVWRRLEKAHGRTLVCNVFWDEWPEEEELSSEEEGEKVRPSPDRGGQRDTLSSPSSTGVKPNIPHPMPSREAGPMNALFSWLHISDLHFGHGDRGHAWDQQLVLRTLRQTVVEHLQTFGVPKPEVILVTGDIAFSGAIRRKEEYQDAKQYLCDLATTLGLTSEAVFLVPGNHDVQRSADTTSLTEVLVQHARNGEDPRYNFEALLDVQETCMQLASRQANYFEFARGFGPRRSNSRGLPFHWHHSLRRPGLNVALLGLNTALLAADDQDYGRLRLGKRAILELLSNLASDQDELVILLSHHPLHRGWLADEKEVMGWMHKHCHIHLFGHDHEAESDQVRRGSTERPLVRVAAGAAHAPRHPSGVPLGHSYNLASVVRNEAGALVLRNWPLRWSHKNKDFRPDVDNAKKGQLYAEHVLELTWKKV